MTAYLSRLIEYNSWANRGLLAFLAGLPPETLDATTTGVYGTIPDLDSWAHGIRVHGDDWPPDWGPEPAER
jgi:hypothetical protein